MQRVTGSWRNPGSLGFSGGPCLYPCSPFFSLNRSVTTSLLPSVRCLVFHSCLCRAFVCIVRFGLISVAPSCRFCTFHSFSTVLAVGRGRTEIGRCVSPEPNDATDVLSLLLRSERKCRCRFRRVRKVPAGGRIVIRLPCEESERMNGPEAIARISEPNGQVRTLRAMPFAHVKKDRL